MGKIYHGGFDDALSWSEPALKPGTGSRYVLEKNITRMDEKKRLQGKKVLKEKTSVGQVEVHQLNWQKLRMRNIQMERRGIGRTNDTAAF